jgi:hypothetical protein
LRNRCGLGLNRNPPFLDGHWLTHHPDIRAPHVCLTLTSARTARRLPRSSSMVPALNAAAGGRFGQKTEKKL